MYKKASIYKKVSILSTIICFIAALLLAELYIASSAWFYMVMCLLMIVNGLIVYDESLTGIPDYINSFLYGDSKNDTPGYGSLLLTPSKYSVTKDK
jgi:uncharacterized membrane protein